MIISREYIPFRKLILRRDKGGELFVKLSKESYPEDMWERVFLDLSEYSLYEREMSWAFRGIRTLIEGFRKLDEEEPYETGYEISYARTADVLWIKGKTMALLLRTGADKGNDIVGLIEVQI